jgi:SAM-dependent methyltransferase
VLRALLAEPALAGLDPDSEAFSIAHRQVLDDKPMLRALFVGFYEECFQMDRRWFGATSGKTLEVGSGTALIKQVRPEVITSDIKALPFVDVVAPADRLPFEPASLRAVYGVNVFHHLPDPRAFFREMLRVLAPGGGVVLIEPFYGPAARVLFQRLHKSEGFDPTVASWSAPEPGGPFSGANQALSFVVFTRDRRTFESEFSGLELVADRPHTQLSYLASGGLNFRQLVPRRLTGAVRRLERALEPLDPWIALQHTVVLRKRTGVSADSGTRRC